LFTPRPLVLTPAEFLAGGADDDLAVVGDEVREVGFDPVEAGAADDGVGFEREFGGPGPKRTMAMTSSRWPFGMHGGRVWLRWSGTAAGGIGVRRTR
jgi:hypothetical protein